MKKKLTLLILLFPFIVFAQTTIDKNGTLSIDFGKKNKTQDTDTAKKEKFVYPSDEEAEEENAPKVKKEKTAREPKAAPATADWKQNGLFKGLFHAGFNGCQIDGDNEWGYKYFGANAGIGAMVRFHQYVSVSMEFEYSMKGAKARYVVTPDPTSSQQYRVEWDYMEIPIGINVNDKKLVMASVGLAPGYMVRDNERNYDGQNVSSNPPWGFPRKFDLSAYGGFSFIIQQHWSIGGKFEYSLLKIRGPLNLSRVNGQYNNVLSFRVMYIMDKSSFKKKK